MKKILMTATAVGLLVGGLSTVALAADYTLQNPIIGTVTSLNLYGTYPQGDHFTCTLDGNTVTCSGSDIYKPFVVKSVQPISTVVVKPDGTNVMCTYHNAKLVGTLQATPSNPTLSVVSTNGGKNLLIGNIELTFDGRTTSPCLDP